MIAAKPCDTCPYRRSTPLGVWSPIEYENLQAHDDNELGGGIYACHHSGELPPTERPFCIGWLADQKRRGVPSMRLRLVLMQSEPSAEVFDAVDENDPDLYGSMVQANAGKRFPKNNKKARKLLRRRSG